MADDKVPERFELLEQTIEQFVETTRQIGIIVSDFQPGQRIRECKRPIFERSMYNFGMD